MIKKLVEKQQVMEKMPPQLAKKEEVESLDLWGEEGVSVSNKIKKFKDFSERSRTKVKAVVVPLSGQSINPNAADHKEVIQKVVEEEMKDV